MIVGMTHPDYIGHPQRMFRWSDYGTSDSLDAQLEMAISKALATVKSLNAEEVSADDVVDQIVAEHAQSHGLDVDFGNVEELPVEETTASDGKRGIRAALRYQLTSTAGRGLLFLHPSNWPREYRVEGTVQGTAVVLTQDFADTVTADEIRGWRRSTQQHFQALVAEMNQMVTDNRTKMRLDVAVAVTTRRTEVDKVHALRRELGEL